MDARTKKLLVQLDDATPGVSGNALERAREHMAKVQESFRGFVWAIEEGELSKKRVGELETLVQQYKAANEKWNKYFTYYLRAKVLKAWLRDHGRPVLAVVAAVLVVVMFFKTTAMLRAWSPSVDDKAVFQNLAIALLWHEGWSDPRIELINGAKYWTVTEGKIDRESYADATGQPIEKRCLYVYANPATSIFDDYFRPNAFGWSGSIKCPEVAMYCDRVPSTPPDLGKLMTVPGNAAEEKKINDAPKVNPNRLKPARKDRRQ